MKRFGIQLYSVKDEIKEYGLDAVLAEIKKAGYDCVEFAGFYGLTPDEMAEKLEKYGLKGVSAHMPASAVAENLPYIDRLGIERVYVAWMGTTTPTSIKTARTAFTGFFARSTAIPHSLICFGRRRQIASLCIL